MAKPDELIPSYEYTQIDVDGIPTIEVKRNVRLANTEKWMVARSSRTVGDVEKLPDYDTLWKYFRTCLMVNSDECRCCKHQEPDKYHDCELRLIDRRERGKVCHRFDFDEDSFRLEYDIDK